MHSAPEALVSTGKTYAELNPVIAVDGSGNYVVVWSDHSPEAGEWGIYGQRFDAAGKLVGDEFLINQTSLADPPKPAVAMNASGTFVVSWTSSQNGGKLYAREYDSSGTPSGNEFLVSSAEKGEQDNRAVAIDPAGDVVVTWHGRGPADRQGIFSQTFLEGDLPGSGPSAMRPNTTVFTPRLAPILGTARSKTVGVADDSRHTTAKAAHSTAIVFIDTSVPDWQMLAAGVHQAAPDDQVILIDPARDGIAQITQALAGRKGVTAIHLFTHGVQASCRSAMCC